MRFAVAANASALPAETESATGWTVAVPSSIERAGGGPATVKDRVAGDGSVFPATSVERTDTTWSPPLSAAGVHGLVQSIHGPVSTWHSKAGLPSEEVKANVGVASVVVPLGPETIVVSGGVLSPGGLVGGGFVGGGLVGGGLVGGGVVDAVVTVIAWSVVSVSPSASATVRRTFLTPAPRKVNDSVRPLPSGHCAPPGPSKPSSTHV